MSGHPDQTTPYRDQRLSSVEISLLDSLTHQKLNELIVGALEFTLDNLTDNPLIKAIPVFGTLIKLHGGYVTVRDRLFMKKVLEFLYPLANTDAQERELFLDELAVDKGSRHKAGHALVLLLDRLDDLHKPQFIGRLCRAKMKGRITMEQLYRLCFIVDRAYIGDLLSIRGLKMGEEINGLLGHQLEGLGLIKGTRSDVAVIGLEGGKITYELNELGASLSNILFESL